MYDLELKRVNRIIRFRNVLGKFKGKEIYLFGVSDNTRQRAQMLRELGIEPCFVMDNDKTKQGSYCSGMKVIDPRDVVNPAASDLLPGCDHFRTSH